MGTVDFELDSKIVVDSLYGSKSGVSNFSAMINVRRRLLASDLVISDIRLILGLFGDKPTKSLIALLGWLRVMLVSKFHVVSLLLL